MHTCPGPVARLDETQPDDYTACSSRHPEAYEEPWWRSYADLLLRDEDTLTDDERDSLLYYREERAVRLGYAVKNAARRWCAMASEINRLAVHGRLPVAGDEGVEYRHVRWLEVQGRADLNSYQRERLANTPGWDASDPSGRPWAPRAPGASLAPDGPHRGR